MSTLVRSYESCERMCMHVLHVWEMLMTDSDRFVIRS